VPFPAPEATPSQPAPPAAARKGGSHFWQIGLGIVVLLCAAAAIAWWTLGNGPNVRYATAPVVQGSVVRAVTATGTVNPELTIIVGTYVSGVIQEISCDYNTKVTRNQSCARIDPRPYQTVVDQAKANLAVARAQLLKDQASLTYAKSAYDRAAILVRTNAVSKDAYDSAQSAYEQAQAQIAFDEATIQQRQAALDAAQVNVDYTNIVSPVDGTVVSRNVTMGQTVAASFQTPTLFLIATDLTRMQVDANVSESDIGGVKEGHKVTFTVDAYPKRTFDGIVTQVRQSPQTVQNVVTYDVVIGASNPDLALKPGLTAATRIVIERRDRVLRVPNQALRYAPSNATNPTDRAHVWVLQDNRPVLVAVTTGLENETHTEITGGELKAGDRVIVSEQQDGSTEKRSSLRAPRL
jgi:HlyD family secretion protein